MAFDADETARIQGALAEFLEKRRPKDEETRRKLDFGYRIKGQSVELTELRPDWRNPEVTIVIPVAKATYVRTASRWRIYWKRADLKWHSYMIDPEVILFEEFLAVVEKDECCCFWG